MHILLLTQYYPPEPGSTSNRLQSLVHCCLKRGIRITVLTSLPNYPVGRIYPGYRGHFCLRETKDDVEIIRTWLLPIRGSGLFARGVTYLSFALSAFYTGLIMAPKADLIIWDTAPMTLGPVALLLAKIRGGKLVTNVCDLWIASLRDLGILREGISLRIATRVEEFLYRHSAVVSGQTEFIVSNIEDRLPDVPTILWRNGADEPSRAHPDVAAIRRSWGIPESRFVVGYAGMFGVAQNLEVLCHAATKVDPSKCTFVLIGDGSAKSSVVGLAQSMGLSNMIFIPAQPHNSMPGVWQAFDCTIISLKKSPVFEGAVPSKMYEAMSYGTPIILAVEGEARKILEQSGAGLAVEPENPTQIAEAIETLQTDPIRRQIIATNARRAVQERFNRDILNDRYIDTLLDVVSRKPKTP